MPEEINRLVTDALADLLWTPSSDGDENLLREGIDPKKIVRVGNIMIDSLEMMRLQIQKVSVFQNYGFQKLGYGVVTLHRPANVDAPEILAKLTEMLVRISGRLPLIFPVHPRTKKNLEGAGLYGQLKKIKSICLVEPLSYVPFMNLVFNCRLVLTDSGGVQEETIYLGIPCLTLRPNTERPVTVTPGTNQLCNPQNVENHFERVMQNTGHERRIPDLWDGRTASRVVASIRQFLSVQDKLGGISTAEGSTPDVSPPRRLHRMMSFAMGIHQLVRLRWRVPKNLQKNPTKRVLHSGRPSKTLPPATGFHENPACH
jgi:UDP-N-acetylglucosamine 2-epimerase (non-hydrolysing)